MREKCFRVALLMLAAMEVAWSNRGAVGGVIDSPLPILTVGGTPARHVFTVPGVIKNNNVETEFACTSLERTASFRFAVEVFGAEGGPPLNDVTPPALNGADTLLPGATRTIGTGSTAGIHEDNVITLPAASLRNGSARIVSESTKITCTAFIVDKLNATIGFNPGPPATPGPVPASMATLKVIKAKRQAGD